MTAPDIYLLAAQHRYRLSPDWQWRQIVSLDDGFIELHGASPISAYKSGPRRGQPRFPPRSQCRRVIVTRQDVADARARWEAETGRCSHCGGEGQEAIGWSAAEGTRYRTCRACSGTGKPVQINPI